MAERDQASKAPEASAVSTSGSADILARLAEVIESRRGGDPSRSYVAKLLAGGDDRHGQALHQRHAGGKGGGQRAAQQPGGGR